MSAIFGSYLGHVTSIFGGSGDQPGSDSDTLKKYKILSLAGPAIRFVWQSECMSGARCYC